MTALPAGCAGTPSSGLDAAERERLSRFYDERLHVQTSTMTVQDRTRYMRDWRRWCAVLTEVGGELVVPPAEIEDLTELLVRARPAPDGAAQSAMLLVGRPNGCHANSSELFLCGEVASIVTGYALTESLWRQHTWALSFQGRIVETTVAREQYVGMQLTTQEALSFAACNP